MCLRLTSIIVCLLVINACATSPTGRSQLAFMPESQMNQMGAQAIRTIQTDTPVDRDTVTNAYVQCIARAITREVGGRWEVLVFRDDAANAFALPGNKIGVYTGLLRVAENQHQLATVIGHEVAHVLSHHANERVSQKFAIDQGLYLINALANPQSGTGQTVMGLLGVGARYGIQMPYNRIQESEADIYGLDLMAQSGFDPRESVKLWQNMSRAGGGQPPEFLSTHPSHSTRISGLSKHMPAALQLQNKARQAGKRPDCKR
ncbi:MAG: M48 family metallopeptidase [Thiohalobacterales bacterium]|nr:M48 family metallopeptidase [Thiohalobacterales bacterium]